MQKKDDLVQQLIGKIITQTILRRFENSSENSVALIVKGFSEDEVISSLDAISKEFEKKDMTKMESLLVERTLIQGAGKIQTPR